MRYLICLLAGLVLAVGTGLATAGSDAPGQTTTSSIVDRTTQLPPPPTLNARVLQLERKVRTLERELRVLRAKVRQLPSP